MCNSLPLLRTSYKIRHTSILSLSTLLFKRVKWRVIFKKKNLDHLEGGFPGGTVVENLPANAGHAEDMGSVPGSGRSPGEGKGSPFQYSCLENLMDGGAWQTAIQGVANSQTQLSDWACAHTHTHTHTRARVSWVDTLAPCRDNPPEAARATLTSPTNEVRCS